MSSLIPAITAPFSDYLGSPGAIVCRRRSDLLTPSNELFPCSLYRALSYLGLPNSPRLLSVLLPALFARFSIQCPITHGPFVTQKPGV